MHVAKCGDLALRFNRHLEGFPQRCSDLTQPRRHRGIMQEHFAARSSPAECKSHSNTATCSRRGYHCSVLIHDARRHLGSRRVLGIANCLRSDAGGNSHPEAHSSSLPVCRSRGAAQHFGFARPVTCCKHRGKHLELNIRQPLPPRLDPHGCICCKNILAHPLLHLRGRRQPYCDTDGSTLVLFTLVTGSGVKRATQTFD